ncbi:MAG: type IV toxin-antitoxin system AbiEi family antitoxin domain-containing protein [Clostridiales bacterium]|jgi:predicted transcriptional regulator of viral defense system|nr:type IV toxin-antitoxin system AbiEi family antitoxin domain-containing protein [Clostridiales bacterium]
MAITAFEKIQAFLKESDGILRTEDAKALNVSRTTLSNLEKAGLLYRAARGQYILPDSLPDELYLWQQRVSGMIYSHETALFLHGMAERTPAQHSVTLSGKARLSESFPSDYKVYYVKPALWNTGVTSIPSKMGHVVQAYDAERTVCDILRSRTRIDDQIVAAAMKSYARRKGQDLKKLGEYAALFRVTAILRRYLEVLL